MTTSTCPACAGTGTGVLSTYHDGALVDRYACDLCADEGVCEHGIRRPHECRECADAPSDEGIAAWLQRRDAT